MNRVLIIIVGLATVALLGFAVFVFTSGGPGPAVAPTTESAQPAAALAAPETPPTATTTATQGPPAATTTAAAPTATTPEAAERFDAWAKPLREAGLTLTARAIATQGDTLAVSDLTISGPDEVPGWRWTVQNAAVFDREPFHLQAAGTTMVTLTTGADSELSWSGRVDAFGIAVQRDPRDVLSQSVIFRVNGLSLAGPDGSAPLTLSDGQLRLFISGRTGLLPVGTRFTLRLTDMTVPAMANTTLGSKIKSFTAEFGLNQKLDGYGYREAIGLFDPRTNGIRLGTIALDWGALRFIGNGELRLPRTGVLDGTFDVRLTDLPTLLDAIAAAGETDMKALAETYAAALLEMGSDPEAGTVPFTLTVKEGAITLEGASRGLDDIPLGRAPTIVTGAGAP